MTESDPDLEIAPGWRVVEMGCSKIWAPLGRLLIDLEKGDE